MPAARPPLKPLSATPAAVRQRRRRERLGAEAVNRRARELYARRRQLFPKQHAEMLAARRARRMPDDPDAAAAARAARNAEDRRKYWETPERERRAKCAAKYDAKRAAMLGNRNRIEQAVQGMRNEAWLHAFKVQRAGKLRGLTTAQVVERILSDARAELLRKARRPRREAERRPSRREAKMALAEWLAERGLVPLEALRAAWWAEERRPRKVLSRLVAQGNHEVRRLMGYPPHVRAEWRLTDDDLDEWRLLNVAHLAPVRRGQTLQRRAVRRQNDETDCRVALGYKLLGRRERLRLGEGRAPVRARRRIKRESAAAAAEQLEPPVMDHAEAPPLAAGAVQQERQRMEAHRAIRWGRRRRSGTPRRPVQTRMLAVFRKVPEREPASGGRRREETVRI